MKKYREKNYVKPVVIEAIKFDPRGEWPACVIPWPVEVQPRDMSCGYVESFDEKMHVLPGDYIVKEADGNFYVRSPEIFESMFEEELMADNHGARKRGEFTNASPTSSNRRTRR